MISRLLHTQAVRRFVRYSSVGISTFAFDLALLFVLTDFLNLHYLLSAPIAYAIALSVQYVLARRYVFIETQRSAKAGYVFFLTIGGTGLFLVTGLMYLCVDVFGLHYLTSRVMVACLVGVWSYLANFYINFRVARTIE